MTAEDTQHGKGKQTKQVDRGAVARKGKRSALPLGRFRNQRLSFGAKKIFGGPGDRCMTSP
jgi:hypothetical protein